IKKNQVIKKDHENLQGNWRLDYLNIDGRSLSRAKFKWPTSKLTIKVNKFSLTIKPDKVGHAIQGASFEATFKLDPTKEPKAFDLTVTTGPDKGKTLSGIYFLALSEQADLFKISFAKVGSDRPADFKGGSGTVEKRNGIV